MDAKLQRRVQRYGWDRSAAQYESSWRDQLEPAQTLMLDMARLCPGERVLDVACGTGLVTVRAARSVLPGGEVVGTDISDEMVATAGRLSAERGVSNVRYRRGEAERIEWDDASFDAVVCGLGLMYVPSPPEALAEFLRVLKTGGRTSVSVWGRRDACGWAEIFPIVDARVNTEVCPAFFQLGTGETLSLLLSAAGFRDVDLQRIRTTLRYDSPDAAVAAVFSGGPVAMAYSRFDAATREAAHAEYLASIEGFLKDGRYEIPGEFVVAAGRKE